MLNAGFCKEYEGSKRWHRRTTPLAKLNENSFIQRYTAFAGAFVEMSSPLAEVAPDGPSAYLSPEKRGVLRDGFSVGFVSLIAPVNMTISGRGCSTPGHFSGTRHNGVRRTATSWRRDRGISSAELAQSVAGLQTHSATPSMPIGAQGIYPE